ncbi:MAG: YdcH family protein [Rhodoferax sp.]|nr:YdcH family protein [Rhodoferax sp.]MDZ7892081.1 YdcH family protein [Rhodoferax sp.]
METNLHSPERRLIELRMAHSDLDACIDLASSQGGIKDELLLQRLKKRRLGLRDTIFQLQRSLGPNESA